MQSPAPPPPQRATDHVNRVRASGRWLLVAIFCSVMAIVAAHFAVTYAANDEIDPIVAAVDGTLALMLMLAAVAHVRTLGRERIHHAVVEELVAALEVPRSVEDAAADAATLLADTGVAEAVLVAVTHTPTTPTPAVEANPTVTPAPELATAAAVPEQLVPIAAIGYPDQWLEHASPRSPIPGQREPTVAHMPRGTEWMPPRQGDGPRRWVATLPLWRGDELLGEITLVSHRKRLLGRPALLLTISSVVAAALDTARLHQAAYEETRTLEQQEARRREFLYAIAHELRTPLTSIQTFADLLQSEHVGDPATDLLLNSLSRGVTRLSSLVNDLLDLGRVQQPEVHLQITAVDVGAALRNAEAILRPSFMSRRQALELNIPGGSLLAIGDARALEQVMLNLLSNAHRFSPEEGRVTVRAGRQGDRVRIDVEDSGPGVAPEDRSAIFQAFYRVRRPGAPEVPGSGLGLAVARRLMELQSGSIWVDSATDGNGSRFSVTIPAVPNDVLPSQIDPSPAAPATDPPPAPLPPVSLPTEPEAQGG